MTRWTRTFVVRMAELMIHDKTVRQRWYYAWPRGPRVHNSELLHLYEVRNKNGVKELDFTNFDQSSYKIILLRLRKLI